MSLTPRPRKKGKRGSADPPVETDPAVETDHPAVSDEEWEAFFRRSLALGVAVLEVPAPSTSLPLPPGSDDLDSVAPEPVQVCTLADARAFLVEADPGVDVEAPVSTALPAPAEVTTGTELEALSLAQSLAEACPLEDRVLPAPPAAAPDVRSLEWRDRGDLVLLGIVLDWWVRGISLESRAPAVRAAVLEIPGRYSDLMRRVEALLPPR